MNRYEKLSFHPEGASLTDRQQQVMILMAHGCTNQEIAESLGVKLETVRHHRKAAYMRLGAHNQAQAAMRCVQRGIL